MRIKEIDRGNGLKELKKDVRALVSWLILGMLLGGLVFGWILVPKYEWRFWIPYWALFGLFWYANIRSDEKERENERLLRKAEKGLKKELKARKKFEAFTIEEES